ncbi:MAG TPA: tetratricopeptide repeat protein [Beijerinckiaceae bacterium]|nr:tetratricopeptide repeat protein [Beijerinckiaceae bacterium]
MSDIFREIEQEVRREEALKLWAKYQIPIIAAAVLIVLATAGWRFWESRVHGQDERAGARYEAALTLAHQGKTKQAEAALAALAKSGPAGYRLLARLSLANEEASSDPAAAVKLYDSIALDHAATQPIQETAQLRAALLRSDVATRKEIVRRLDPLAAPSNPYHVTARELLALVALKHKDYQAAGHWLQSILTDPTTPVGARQRATALLSLVAAASPAAPPKPAAPSPAKPALAAPSAPQTAPPASAAAPAKSQAHPATAAPSSGAGGKADVTATPPAPTPASGAGPAAAPAPGSH